MERSMKHTLAMLCQFGLAILALNLPIQTTLANNALIIRGTDSSFDEVVKGMSEDLEGEVSLTEVLVKKGLSAADVAISFKQNSPDIVIPIGNKAVNLYTKYQQANSSSEFPPSIAMAALFVDKFVSKLKNATAIRYEIPAVTSAVAMRTVLGKPIKRLGVVYRAWMSDIIEENKRFCKAEGIDLIGVKLPNKAGKMEDHVKDALKTLSKNVDALWILNDNSLLTRNALLKAWLPSRGSSDIPAIVGIKQFMTKIPLGSFAIVPDNYGLGAQAAGMIFEVMENDWELENTDIQQPVSVKKFVSVATLKKKGIGYQESKLSSVDEVIR